jgi:hypothetical protein
MAKQRKAETSFHMKRKECNLYKPCRTKDCLGYYDYTNHKIANMEILKCRLCGAFATMYCSSYTKIDKCGKKRKQRK